MSVAVIVLLLAVGAVVGAALAFVVEAAGMAKYIEQIDRGTAGACPVCRRHPLPRRLAE